MPDAAPPTQPFSPQRAGNDEQTLLAALAENDREAAAEIVDRTYRAVYTQLCRLTDGDAELAADLTQETYRRAWSALPGFDGRSRLATWMYRIAYNTFLNHVRRPQRLVPLEEGHVRVVTDPDPGADQEVERKDEARHLWRAVLALPETLRFAVTAHYWGEVPVREIAQAEGVTQPAVRKRLKKALRILGNAMEVPS